MLVLVPSAAGADTGPPYAIGSPDSNGDYAVCNVLAQASFHNSDASVNAGFGVGISCFTSFDSSDYAPVVTWDFPGATVPVYVAMPASGTCGPSPDSRCVEPGGLEVAPYDSYGSCDSADYEGNFVPSGYPPCEMIDDAEYWTCTLYYDGEPALDGEGNPLRCAVQSVYVSADGDTSSYAICPAPSEYWEGETGASPGVSCTVNGFDATSGDFSISVSGGSVVSLVNSGYSPNYGFRVVQVLDGFGDTYPLAAPADDSGGGSADAPTGTLSGSIGELTSDTSGGLFFDVEMDVIPVGVVGPGDDSAFLEGLSVPAGAAQCFYAVNPASPPGSPGGTTIICPDGSGTCASLSNCPLDEFDFTILSVSFAVPNPLEFPGWLWCAAQQGLEWALYPTTGLESSWESLPPVLENHVPSDWIAFGSDYVKTFVTGIYDGSSDLHGCAQVTPSGTLLGIDWGSGLTVCGGGGLSGPVTLTVGSYNAISFGDVLYEIGIIAISVALVMTVLALAKGIITGYGRMGSKE